MNKTITICAALTFSAILIWYWWIGGNPLHRWPYALFVSVVPGIVTYWIANRKAAWWRVTVVYVVLFLIVAGAQALLRTI